MTERLPITEGSSVSQESIPRVSPRVVKEQIPVSVELAALCVRKAIAKEFLDTDHLVGTGGECHRGGNINRIRWALFAHKARLRGAFLRRVVGAVLLAVPFFETPLWCCSPGGPHCDDPAYFTFGLPVLSGRSVIIMDFVLWLLMVIDLSLWAMVIGITNFRTCEKVVHANLLMVMAVDIVWAVRDMPRCCHWRLTPYLRVLLFAFLHPQIFREVKTFISGISAFLRMLLLLELFVVVSAWFATVAFTGTDYERAGFGNIAESFWSLQVLLTTNNFPNVMMPGYTKRRIHGVFFVVFIILGLYLLLQMVIAVVYQGYLQQKKLVTQMNQAIQKTLLDQAFEFLDEDSKGWLTLARMSELLIALGLDEQVNRNLIVAVLDKNGRGRVVPEDFGHLTMVLRLRFAEIERRPWLQDASPWLWKTCCCSTLQQIMNDSTADRVLDVVIVLYTMLNILESWPLISGSGEKWHLVWWGDLLDLVFSALCVVELLCKVLVLGAKVYWQRSSHRFDALVTSVSVGCGASRLFGTGTKNHALLEAVVSLRILRIARVLRSVPGCGAIFVGISASWAGARRVIPLFILTFSFFTVLGCDLFGGLISVDSKEDSAELLAKTDFAEGGFYPLNFNDRASGTMLLFACLVMNNWNTYTDAFVAVSGLGARVFFLSFWFCGVLSGLNLLLAVVLNAVVNELKEAELNPRRSGVVLDAEVITGTVTGVQGLYEIFRDDSSDDDICERSHAYEHLEKFLSKTRAQ